MSSFGKEHLKGRGIQNILSEILGTGEYILEISLCGGLKENATPHTNDWHY